MINYLLSCCIEARNDSIEAWEAAFAELLRIPVIEMELLCYNLESPAFADIM